MNITGLNMQIAADNAKNQIGIAVLDKALETNESMGNSMIKIIDSATMENSVYPSIGGNIDVRV